MVNKRLFVWRGMRYQRPPKNSLITGYLLLWNTSILARKRLVTSSMLYFSTMFTNKPFFVSSVKSW